MKRTVLIRMASDEELRTERWGIAGTDQAAIVIIDGQVVCWSDDYGTIRSVPNGPLLDDEAKSKLAAAVESAFEAYTSIVY